jgi:transcriptional regulator with XRE-family HTH domain
MDITTVISNSPNAVIKGIAERVKARRLERDLTQKAFAARAGMGYDAYRKFESTGEISLRNLVQCALVLDQLEGFNNLFTTRQYTSLDALVKSQQTKQRGRRNE